MDLNDNIDLRYTQLPWTEKYKPYKLDDIYIPQNIKDKFENIINTKNISNIILTGPPGIGKSVTIKAVAYELYNKYYNDAVLELNLLDEKCIKFMQTDIILFCKTKISYKKNDDKHYPNYKLIIFNEADNIIDRIQDQISNLMGSFSNNVRFIFTCNSSSEINESIQSKCFIWRYTYLPNSLVIEKLKDICHKENITFTESSLDKIATLSRGDIRNAVNKLQLLYNKYDNIKEEYVNELCDTPQEVIIKQIFINIINNNCNEALKIIFDLKNKSYSGSDITLGMLFTIRSPICDDIEESIKIKLAEGICNGIIRISKGIDSNLQLAGCIIDMINHLI